MDSICCDGQIFAFTVELFPGCVVGVVGRYVVVVVSPGDVGGYLHDDTLGVHGLAVITTDRWAYPSPLVVVVAVLIQCFGAL